MSQELLGFVKKVHDRSIELLGDVRFNARYEFGRLKDVEVLGEEFTRLRSRKT